jgi:hypothetical protein
VPLHLSISPGPLLLLPFPLHTDIFLHEGNSHKKNCESNPHCFAKLGEKTEGIWNQTQMKRNMGPDPRGRLRPPNQVVGLRVSHSFSPLLSLLSSFSPLPSPLSSLSSSPLFFPLSLSLHFLSTLLCSSACAILSSFR